MEQPIDTKEMPQEEIILDPKEVDFFVERFAQILLMQLEHENNHEHEEETRRIPETV